VLKTVPGIGAVYQGAPRRAAFPNAVVDGIESDWGHKSGAGREVRLAATLRDGAEQAGRLRSLASGAEAALAGIGRDLDGWSLVTFQFVRRRTVPDGQGWAAIIEFRARMLQR
jgi:hypothetical protein